MSSFLRSTYSPSTTGIGLRRVSVNLGEDANFTSLEDSPSEFQQVNTIGDARKNLSDLSRLHNSDDRYGSESVVSFDSISTKSEVAFRSDQPAPVVARPCYEKGDSVSVGSPASRTSCRRGSCPSILEGPKDTFRLEMQVDGTRRRGLSMSHVDGQEKVVTLNESGKLSAAERRERLKLSLSRLSHSVASVAESLASSKKLKKETVESEISDILSPESSIPGSPTSILLEKKHTSTIHVSRPPPGPSAGNINDLGTGKLPTMYPQFIPSGIGRLLMAIYGTDKPQEPMWTTFVAKAKGPLEFADAASRMPSVVFCLRGLIRFGNGEYGASRTDCLPHLINILLRRHPISETPSLLEAVECSAAILAMLCVNPVTRQMNTIEHRKKFESVMTTQNGFLFQQFATFLTACLPRCMQTESDTSLITRAASSVLDVVYVYSLSPLLRNSWLPSAPIGFKQTFLVTLSTIGEKLPSLLHRCVLILDVLLDHMDVDGATCRRIGQCMRGSVSRAPSPQVATEAAQLIRRWGQQTQPNLSSNESRKRQSSIGSFFRSLGGKRDQQSAGTLSIKPTIYAEYSHT